MKRTKVVLVLSILCFMVFQNMGFPQVPPVQDRSRAAQVADYKTIKQFYGYYDRIVVGQSNTAMETFCEDHLSKTYVIKRGKRSEVYNGGNLPPFLRDNSIVGGSFEKRKHKTFVKEIVETEEGYLVKILRYARSTTFDLDPDVAPPTGLLSPKRMKNVIYNRLDEVWIVSDGRLLIQHSESRAISVTSSYE